MRLQQEKGVTCEVWAWTREMPKGSHGLLLAPLQGTMASVHLCICKSLCQNN